jgi:replicative DNA helicase
VPDTQSLESSPHDLAAEKAVIGAMLVDPSMIPAALAVGLRADAFFRDAHMRVWSAIEANFQNNELVDLVTVSSRLSERGDLDRCGGPAYIAALTDGVPRAANVAAYARIVLSLASDRAVEAAFVTGLSAVRRRGSAEAIEQFINQVGDQAPRESVKLATAAELMELEAAAPMHPDWPMISRGSLAGVVGGSGCGKTFVAIRLAADLIRAGQRVAIAALEGMAGLSQRLKAAALRNHYLKRDEAIDHGPSRLTKHRNDPACLILGHAASLFALTDPVTAIRKLGGCLHLETPTPVCT